MLKYGGKNYMFCWKFSSLSSFENWLRFHEVTAISGGPLFIQCRQKYCWKKLHATAYYILCTVLSMSAREQRSFLM